MGEVSGGCLVKISGARNGKTGQNARGWKL
jgi:hypothetical protein